MFTAGIDSQDIYYHNLELWLLEQSSIAIDTETGGLEWDAPVRLVQFGNSEKGWCVDTSTNYGRTLVCKIIKNYNGTIIFHNASFDIHALERIGVSPDFLWQRCWDTYTMAHLLDPAGLHGLKPLCKTLLGEDSDEEQKELKLFMRTNKYNWETVPLENLVPYAIKDAVLTHRLFTALYRKFEPKLQSALEREMEVAEVVYRVESNGLLLDTDYAVALKEKWETAIASDLEWFNSQGIVNPNSNRQVSSRLKGDGWIPTDITPSGEIKLDKTVLESLAPIYPIAERLLSYKQKTKWLSAYVINSLQEADKNGYVHARYNSLGARTGRMSCSNPPLQQLPTGGGGDVRRLFIASPGNIIASVDYSAIELRLAGALSGETKIIDAYANGKDIYQDVADSIGSSRTTAKVVVLASLYGAGGETVGRNIGIPTTDATRLVAAFWEAYPTLSRWVLSQTNKSRRTTPTSLWGRRLSPHAPYAAANAIIQGTAADVLKDGLLRLSEKGLIKYVAAIVHDEVILDIPAENAKQILKEVSDTLEDSRFSIPLTTESEEYGFSWAGGYNK